MAARLPMLLCMHAPMCNCVFPELPLHHRPAVFRVSQPFYLLVLPRRPPCRLSALLFVSTPLPSLISCHVRITLAVKRAEAGNETTCWGAVQGQRHKNMLARQPHAGKETQGK